MVTRDSGYPLCQWLLTPVLHPTTETQERYHVAHIRTRNVIERACGVLKLRLQCIDKSVGTLVYSAQRACVTAVADNSAQQVQWISNSITK